MIISLIAAVDECGGIGKNNRLLCYLPADLKHFKALTLEKTVIMGRKTFDSIGKPLINRENIVVSRQAINIPGILRAASLEEALDKTKTQEAMIIGGASIYQQSIKFANNIYLTLIHHSFKADVFFPPINNDYWRCLNKVFRQQDEKNPYDMTFMHYGINKDFYEKEQQSQALN